jgi:hypothetical protein
VQVNEYDCLLLEFVFGQRPDDAQKVKTYVLENISSDPELQKAEILFLGSFGRACEYLSSGNAEVREPPFQIDKLHVTAYMTQQSSWHGLTILNQMPR